MNIILSTSRFTLPDVFICILAIAGLVWIGFPGLAVALGEMRARRQGMRLDYTDPRWSKGCIRLFGAILVAISVVLWFTCRRDEDVGITDKPKPHSSRTWSVDGQRQSDPPVRPSDSGDKDADRPAPPTQPDAASPGKDEGSETE